MGNSKRHRQTWPVSDRRFLANLVTDSVATRWGGKWKDAELYLRRACRGRRPIGRRQLKRFAQGEVSEVTPRALECLRSFLPPEAENALMSCLSFPRGVDRGRSIREALDGLGRAEPAAPLEGRSRVVELAALQADWKLRFGDICKPLEVGISEAAQEAAWGRMTDPLLTGGSGPPRTR